MFLIHLLQLSQGTQSSHNFSCYLNLYPQCGSVHPLTDPISTCSQHSKSLHYALWNSQSTTRKILYILNLVSKCCLYPLFRWNLLSPGHCFSADLRRWCALLHCLYHRPFFFFSNHSPSIPHNYSFSPFSNSCHNLNSWDISSPLCFIHFQASKFLLSFLECFLIDPCCCFFF